MTTVWGAGEVDVLGITLIKPRPLYRTYLPLDAGLSVLYGKNGAGKSRILEGVEAAINGQQGRTWSWLHIRLRPGTTGMRGSLLHGIAELLAQGNLAYDSSVGDQCTSDEVVSALSRELERTLGYGSFPDELAGLLAREVSGAGHLALMPVGSGEEHRWRLYVAASPSDDTPQLSRLASNYRRDFERALLLESDDERQEALFDAHESFGLEEAIDVFDDMRVPFAHGDGPYPLFELGQLDLSAPLCDVYGRATRDLDELTLKKLRFRDHRERKLLEAGTDKLSADVLEDIEHLSARATSLMASVIEDGLPLRCLMAPVEAWAVGPALTWVADSPGAPIGLPLHELSQAQERWSRLVIAATLTEFTSDGGRGVMLVDEPEQALHAQAVRHMAAGLNRLANLVHVDVIAATHAAALLDLEDAGLRHVARDRAGLTVVQALPGVDDTALATLGLTRTELLQLTRLFVLVEGSHDEQVLKIVCSAELEHARARLICMRGGQHAPSLIDAQFLLNYSDANFLVVLDNIVQERIEDAWDRARASWRSSGLVEVVAKGLRADLPGSAGIENKFVRELMLSAIVQGQDHRVRFRGLSKPDIVYYLPISAFTAKPYAWEGLAERHEAANTKQSFKDWLEGQHGFSFEAAAIDVATASLDDLHPDLSRLASDIRTA